MDITSPTSLVQVAQLTQTSTATTRISAPERKEARGANLDKADKAAQIMKNYDLHNITYKEKGKMAGELYEAGVITGEQRMMMTAPQGRHIMVNGSLVFDDYGKKDYLKESELALAFAEKNQASDIRSLTYMRTMDNLLHNLDTLRSQA